MYKELRQQSDPVSYEDHSSGHSINLHSSEKNISYQYSEALFFLPQNMAQHLSLTAAKRCVIGMKKKIEKTKIKRI